MIKYKGGNGSSKQESIIILGADNEAEGIDAEFNWLEAKYGEENEKWVMVEQHLLDEGNKQYDILKIKFLAGDTEDFWFDITDFYEKDDG